METISHALRHSTVGNLLRLFGFSIYPADSCYTSLWVCQKTIDSGRKLRVALVRLLLFWSPPFGASRKGVPPSAAFPSRPASSSNLLTGEMQETAEVRANEVLDSAKFIASKATDVTVSTYGVLKAAKRVSSANNLCSISTKSLISHSLMRSDRRVHFSHFRLGRATHLILRKKIYQRLIGRFGARIRCSDIPNCRIFLVDTLNFSFWPSHPENQFTVAYPEKRDQKKLYTGYWSLCAAVNRALEVHQLHLIPTH